MKNHALKIKKRKQEISSNGELFELTSPIPLSLREVYLLTKSLKDEGYRIRTNKVKGGILVYKAVQPGPKELDN